MHHDEDLTAAERLEALAELFARGVDRLAMQRTRKHTQGISHPVHEEHQVAGSQEALAK
jgi:hypothetical protein